MNLNNIIIVLARPSVAGNVGAVCRAMKNMGLSQLRLTAPALENMSDVRVLQADAGDEPVIRARAVHAAEVWENSKTFETLSEAVSDCSLVIGTTRRRGRRRKQITMTPAETAVFLKKHPGPAALVFGNERTGLNDEELELCNMASHIPTDGVFPSLNLSHAVMIYAYELFRALKPLPDEAMVTTERILQPVKGQWVPLDQNNLKKTVREVTDSLKSLGFYTQRSREEQERFFLDVFSRAGLTEWEGGYFSDIIAKAARLGLLARDGK
ncbi:MAG: RNA methyltransferase [Treponema sp.]|jgi:tRNA/rRNA methyltransferase/tRNA (cytidine32/uridine32-2'-O)-methyltransferase|nr:RNA methyltransferase [Treponema sp.]